MSNEDIVYSLISLKFFFPYFIAFFDKSIPIQSFNILSSLLIKSNFIPDPQPISKIFFGVILVVLIKSTILKYSLL
jgi:hypothetical protein